MSNLFEFDTALTDYSKADVKNLAYVGALPTKLKVGRDSDSWYTPQKYLESARATMGSIDLDPFSSEIANQKVGAARYHTEDNSSLDVDWVVSTVWMNPPYGPLMKDAAAKFLEQFTKKNFSEGIILVNNATDTKWFAALSEHASAYCFTDHRINFENVDGKNMNGNTRGQIFIYFGANTQKFKQEFTEHGLVLQKV